MCTGTSYSGEVHLGALAGEVHGGLDNFLVGLWCPALTLGNRTGAVTEAGQTEEKSPLGRQVWLGYRALKGCLGLQLLKVMAEA